MKNLHSLIPGQQQFKKEEKEEEKKQVQINENEKKNVTESIKNQQTEILYETDLNRINGLIYIFNQI
jgi:hypothetical protein